VYTLTTQGSTSAQMVSFKPKLLIKQLQSQINPHFLYNCLFFINNMVRLGHDDAIVAMSHNLAEYFRYTTRTEKPLAAIRAEAKVVANYLTIQSLRMDRLQYRIDIPEQLMELEIPRLLIQPIVENSIVHGIENKRNSGTIQITGKEDHRFYYLLVEDDGMGMTTDSIAELMQKINLPLDDAMGCALWNIQQRLHIHFGEESGMRFYPSSIGGLTTEIYWLK
jgi:two-component system sensor histidine kinase YesM